MNTGCKSLLAVCFLFCSVTIISAQQIAWHRAYGGDRTDWGNCVKQTIDGGYIIAGKTNSFGEGAADYYVIKTDSNGDTIWTKTFGGAMDDAACSALETCDGEFLIVGYTESFDDYSNIYIIKTNISGDTLWTSLLEGTNYMFPYSAGLTADGGLIITGVLSDGCYWDDIFLVKTDSAGNLTWLRSYGRESLFEFAHSVQQTADEGYIIAGKIHNYYQNFYDFYIIKTDSIGDTLWTNVYGGSSGEFARSIQQTNDGGYIIAGETFSFGGYGNDFYLVKIDSLGNMLWDRNYDAGNLEIAYCVRQTDDNGYIAVGQTYPYPENGPNLYVIRTDAEGDSLWTLIYGGEQSDRAFCVELTDDGGYIIAGYTRSFGSGFDDFWLIKLEEYTSAENNAISVPEAFSLLENYPNPFNSQTVIVYHVANSSLSRVKTKIEIYDILGRKVTTLLNEKKAPGSYKIFWNGRDDFGDKLPSGVYFARIEQWRKRYLSSTRKLLLVK